MRITVYLSAAILTALLLLYITDDSPGENKISIYNIEPSMIESIRVSSEKKKLDYKIEPYPYKYSSHRLYKFTDDSTLERPGRERHYFSSAMVLSLLDSISSLKAERVLNDSEKLRREARYEDCTEITLKLKEADEIRLCAGAGTYNDRFRYLWYNHKVYLVKSFIPRRFEKDPYIYRSDRFFSVAAAALSQIKITLYRNQSEYAYTLEKTAIEEQQTENRKTLWSLKNYEEVNPLYLRPVVESVLNLKTENHVKRPGLQKNNRQLTIELSAEESSRLKTVSTFFLYRTPRGYYGHSRLNRGTVKKRGLERLFMLLKRMQSEIKRNYGRSPSGDSER